MFMKLTTGQPPDFKTRVIFMIADIPTKVTIIFSKEILNYFVLDILS